MWIFEVKKKNNCKSINQNIGHLIHMNCILWHWKCLCPSFNIRISLTVDKVVCSLFIVHFTMHVTDKGAMKMKWPALASERCKGIKQKRDRNLNGKARNEWVEWIAMRNTHMSDISHQIIIKLTEHFRATIGSHPYLLHQPRAHTLHTSAPWINNLLKWLPN